MADESTDVIPSSGPKIRFRLTQLDTLTVAPTESSSLALRTSPLLPRGHQFYKAPVIRIFGSTAAGQRVVAHIHGAMPYFYVQYEAALDPDTVHSFIRRLGASLNYATAASLGRINSNRQTDQAKHQYVGYIALCKGIPFYGYHVGYRYFLKIYCLQSKFKKRMAELLRGGKVMSPLGIPRGGVAPGAQPNGFKIFEEHIPFHLQFMLDYNLYGCGWVELSDCLFRRPLPDRHLNNGVSAPIYLATNIPESQFGPLDLKKASYCPVELDCHVSSIMNRHAVKERALHHDFVELLGGPVPDEEKLVQSVKELWEDERRRRRRRGQSGPEEVRESGPTSQREYATGEQPAWFTEAAFRAQIEDMIRQRRQTSAQKRVDDPSEPTSKFRQFIKPESNLSKLIPTTFQAVEAIHQQKWEKDEEEENPYGVWAIHGIGIGSNVKSKIDVPAEEKHATKFTEDADVDIDIDVAAIQSQMESYRDDALEEDADLAGNPDIDADEEEFDELNLDEVDALGDGLGPPDQPVTHPGGSKNITPRKSKSKTWTLNNQSPAISPSKRHRQHTDGFQSPPKPPLGEHLSGSSPTAARKRELEEQDDGFNQPKAGKMMRFVERHPRFTSNTSPVMARDHTSPIIARTEANPSSAHQSRHDSNQGPPPEQIPNIRGDTQDIPAANTNHFLLQDIALSDLDWSQSTQASLPPSRSKLLASSPGSAQMLSSEALNGDEKAKKRLDVAILTQTQRPKTDRFDVQWYQYSARCPSTAELMDSLSDYDLPMKVYRDPFYSDPADIPERKREYGGRQYAISGSSLRFIPDFEHVAKRFGSATSDSEKPSINVRRWEFASPPPTLSELRKTMINKKMEKSSNFLLVSQIEGPTQHNGGFKYTQVKSKSTAHESQHMDFLAIEVHADSRDDLRPDPSADEIKVLFYCLQSERPEIEFLGRRPNTCLGAIIVDKNKDNPSSTLAPLASTKCALGLCTVEVVDSELELLNSLIDKVRAWDPEVLTGFELESWSWGYVMRRGRELDFDLIYEFGRVKSESHGRFAGKDDKWGYTHGSSIKVTGRHVLSIWRIIRSEVALTQYTFENVVYHVLRRRVPHYSFTTLAKWWKGDSLENKRRVMLYYLDRVDLDTQLVDETEMISRNAEISRTLGVDFFSAISRGSQFKVESVLFRIAKPENYMLPSPSREEVGKQNAAECIPLVMEPESAFYKSPLLVLDFQSLYPSVMIAYNYCYSTCLGRAGLFKGTNKLGTCTLDLPSGLLEIMKDDLIVSPNGLIFAKHHVRKSLLSKMLSEFLDTRVMIKQSMKLIKDDKALTKMLNARQLGLKFIANVTYGYTSASFSGRMPCVEIADAIVQTGRETLEKSMEFIHSVKEWDAKVVYGDTDSLFVYLPGRTKDQAFKIGNEMADAITRRNPAPVKLKFEKVYLPCVLMAKKRYVGSKYENLTDTKPEFDAKGIEVIRRDGIPALQKIQETCLKKLFETQDLSEIKAYLYRQWQRLLLGKVSIQDFTFAKEVKLGTYSEKGPPPPGALIAARKMAADPRTEPAYAERVPYVIVKGAPQSRLRDRAVSPETLLQTRLLSLDAEYYITRVFIPSLARIFNLVGADVAGWYQSMPKMMRATKSAGVVETSLVQKELGDKNTLPGERENLPAPANASALTNIASKANKFLVDEHFRSDRCLNCDDEGHQGILCASCGSNPTQVSYSLLTRARGFGKRRADVEAICRDCSATPPSELVECDSLDCSLLYERTKAKWLAQDGMKLVTAVDHINKGVKLNEVKTLDW